MDAFGTSLIRMKMKVSDEEMKAINLKRDKFHGEWNYSIVPP
ncbi:MAG: hypothetical protein GQ565_11870 [Candidatus Aegiribacteria sp.]|nr:hypothetical protein [Candidatus Aegiribacteria sp.]